MSAPAPLLLVGCNHQRTPLAVRERLALSGDHVSRLYERLRASSIVDEVVVLATCNRVEIYAHSAHPDADAAVLRELAAIRAFPEAELDVLAYRKLGAEAIEHLYAVASGLDSQMVGETEILGQVKDAYQQAQEGRFVGRHLHKLFQKSFQAAKWARSNTGISVGQVSLGNVAVDLAQRIFGRLGDARVLVVGSGDVGTDVAKAFRGRGVKRIDVTSRTPGRADAVAAEVQGHVLPFADWQRELPAHDIVLCATSAPGAILTTEAVRTAMLDRPARPLFLIDLALPRDIEAGAAEVANTYLYNLDDLARIANENLAAREAEVERAREGLRSRATNLWQELQPGR